VADDLIVEHSNERNQWPDNRPNGFNQLRFSYRRESSPVDRKNCRILFAVFRPVAPLSAILQSEKNETSPPHSSPLARLCEEIDVRVQQTGTKEKREKRGSSVPEGMIRSSLTESELAV
jgi:hypothetical protein